MGHIEQRYIWSCLECGDIKSHSDQWFNGDICEKCNSFNGMQIRIEAMYLDWLNNFITLDEFANYYELSYFKALRIISIGKRINELKYETNISSL